MHRFKRYISKVFWRQSSQAVILGRNCNGPGPIPKPRYCWSVPPSLFPSTARQTSGMNIKTCHRRLQKVGVVVVVVFPSSSLKVEGHKTTNQFSPTLSVSSYCRTVHSARLLPAQSLISSPPIVSSAFLGFYHPNDFRRCTYSVECSDDVAEILQLFLPDNGYILSVNRWNMLRSPFSSKDRVRRRAANERRIITWPTSQAKMNGSLPDLMRPSFDKLPTNFVFGEGNRKAQRVNYLI